jgi:hypothetical protein
MQSGRFFTRLLLACAACAISVPCVFAQVAQRDEPAKAYSPEGLAPLTNDQVERLKTYPFDVVICKTNQIPAGYVIVAQGSSVSCPGSFPNTWTIKQPGATEVVCKVSPIPGNYVIQGEGSSVSCPGSFPNTWSIRRV